MDCYKDFVKCGSMIDDTMIAFGNFHSYHNYFHRHAIFEFITPSLLEIDFRQLRQSNRSIATDYPVNNSCTLARIRISGVAVEVQYTYFVHVSIVSFFRTEGPFKAQVEFEPEGIKNQSEKLKLTKFGLTCHLPLQQNLSPTTAYSLQKANTAAATFLPLHHLPFLSKIQTK